MNKETIKKHRDSIEEGDATIYLENIDKHGIDDDIDFLVNRLGLTANSRVLDCGYGSGRLLINIRKMFPSTSLYGVEKSKTLFNYSVKDFTKNNIIVECNDFLNYKNNQKFDTIIMSFFLHHVLQLDSYIKHALELLNTNGQLIILDRIAIDTNAKESFITFWDDQYKEAHEWDEDIPNIFTLGDLSKVLVKGYSIENTEILLHDKRPGVKNFPKTFVVVKEGNS